MGLLGLLIGDQGEGYFNLSRDNYDKAIKYFRRAISANPNDYRSLRGMGLAYDAKKQPKLAIDFFNSALKVKSTDYKSHRGKGKALIQIDKFDLAIKSFDAALKTKNTDYKSLWGKGCAYYYLNDYDNSVTFFNRALNLKPDKKDLIEESLECLNGIISAAPDHEEALKAKANILIHNKDFGGALECLNSVIDINPVAENPKNLKILCLKEKSNQYYHTDNLNSAIDCLDEVLTIRPDTEALKKKIDLQLESAIRADIKGNYNTSISFFNEAINCSDSLPDVEKYTKMFEILRMKNKVIRDHGNDLLSTNDYHGALSCYDEVLKNDKDNLDALKGKGRAYLAMGDKKESEKMYKKVLEILPHDFEASDAFNTYFSPNKSPNNYAGSQTNNKTTSGYEMNASFRYNIPTIPPIQNQPTKPKKLDLNSASQLEIALLHGIGPVIAKKAINIRESQGGFESVEDFCMKIDLKPHIAKDIENLVYCTEIIQEKPIEPQKSQPGGIRIVDIPKPKESHNDDKKTLKSGRIVDW